MTPKQLLVSAISLSVIAIASLAHADDPRTDPVFDSSKTPAQILADAQAQKKALAVVTEDGTSYVGIVKEVGKRAVILTELQGREFFDAYIPLDRIVAMTERVRLR